MEATAERSITGNYRTSRTTVEGRVAGYDLQRSMNDSMIPGRVYRSRNFPGVDIINLGDRIMYIKMMKINNRPRIFEMSVRKSDGKRTYNPRYCKDENDPEVEFRESKEQAIRHYRTHQVTDPKRATNPLEYKSNILRDELSSWEAILIKREEEKLREWYKIPKQERVRMELERLRNMGIKVEDPFAPRAPSQENQEENQKVAGFY